MQSKDTQQLQCTFHFAWGFDGSSGHSFYKQKLQDPDASDEHLFATIVIPLRHVKKNNPLRPLWQNPAP